MTREEFLDALDALVAEKHLLKHPFYCLWTEGKLTREHIREYAISYYPHVAAFPTYVSGVHAGCDDPQVRAELLENLVEEEQGLPGGIEDTTDANGLDTDENGLNTVSNVAVGTFVLVAPR